MDNKPQHVALRPHCFEEIIGHKAVVKDVIKQLDVQNKQCFVFTGPAGCGKTTFASVISKYLLTDNIIEIDAGSTSKAEQVRELVNKARFKGFGENPIKVYIINEVQAFSKASWDAMLDIMENPPEHLYFILTTTEPNKVPKAVTTRCASYNLKPLSKKELDELVDVYLEATGADIEDAFIDVVVDKATGSPRQLIQLLDKASSANSRSELNQLLDEVDEDKTIIELARTLAFTKGNGQWAKVQAILKDLKDENPESIRIVVTTYVAGCMLNAKSTADAERLHRILDCFDTPCNPTDKLAPILLSCGYVCFGD